MKSYILIFCLVIFIDVNVIGKTIYGTKAHEAQQLDLSIFTTLSAPQNLELPNDLPLPIIDSIDNPSPGGIFLTPFGPAISDTSQYKNYLMILDTTGKVVSYKLVPNQEQGYVGYHFKEEPNGFLSYMSRKMDGTVYLTDTAYNVKTSLKDTTNPYNRVRYYAHFDLLPNGHYLTVRYDFQYVDLTKFFPKGEPNGAVLQAVVQELDKDKNVIFNWRSLDYVPVSNTLDPLTPAIDYFHPNSQVLDNDGNILLSGRDINAILKINRNTGDVIWTLGGRENQFTFENEREENAPNYFSYQHDIRRLPNGNITLFDNGRQHKPQYSRAVEYELDEANKICKLVWEYDHNKEYYADVYGTTQRLPNGNTLIGWGNYSVDGKTALQELHPDNSTAFECHFPPGMQSQFIYKYPWPVCPLIGTVRNNELKELNTYDFNKTNQKTGIKIICNKLDAYIYNSLKVDKYGCSPVNPDFAGRAPIVSPYRVIFKPVQIYTITAEIHVALSQYPLILNPDKTLIYVRPIEGKGVFEPLQTTYDADNNELIAIADTLGEFIFGYPDIAVIPNPPILLSPKNGDRPNKDTPVAFNWNPKGYFTGSDIQVAEDTTFTKIVIDSSLKVISFSSDIFAEGIQYFWRVRASNEAGNTEWSEIRSFTISAPFISLITPNGGEVWLKDSLKHIIRWDYNVKDSANNIFKVELYRNDTLFKVLNSSLFSVVHAFALLLAPNSNIPDDSVYKVKVTSIKYPDLSSISSSYFTIKSAINDVKEYNENNNILYQNEPNPVNNSTQFKFKTKNQGHVELLIYDIYGNEIIKLVDDYLQAGINIVNWDVRDIPSGNYLCCLKSGLSRNVIKVIVIK